MNGIVKYMIRASPIFSLNVFLWSELYRDLLRGFQGLKKSTFTLLPS